MEFPKRKTNDMQQRLKQAFAALSCLVFTAGCDGLLDVTLPGQLLEENLDDPRLAETIARGAESDFECAFAGYLTVTGLWTSDFFFTDQNLVPQQINQRSPAVQEFPEGNCGGNTIFRPLNVARVQGETTIDKINEWPEAEVANRDYLLAKSYAYAGYSYILLGEAMCELAFDGGAKESREAGWRRAITSLTAALDHATKSNHADAASIANMARVGLARAHLNLGELDKTVTWARQVPANYARVASASESNARRYNQVYSVNGANRTYSVSKAYVDLRVGTVRDPRVSVNDGGGATGFDRLTPIYFQRKYTSRAAPMPFATGREAKLMIAEAVGGQEAVAIINELRATHSLPVFASTDAATIRAQVVEERRRELWLQGTRLGDMLRLNIPFPTGNLPRGSVYGPLTCIPLPDVELLGNENI